ncbi:MAG: MFS transporter [Dehalococcoidia bacterium]|nr:MFS transporter [Dehalococcoidia bacterium]
MKAPLPNKKSGIFYGYWVVLAGTLIATLNSGTFVFGFGAFFKPITQEMGWSRTALSGAFSITQLEGGILGPLDGWLVDKFGARKILLIGVPLLGIGFFLIGFVNSLFTLYLVFMVFMSLGIALGSVSTVTAAVANWFRKKQSTMLGIALAGVGLGAAIVPIINVLIDALGWRYASMVLGTFTVVVGIPLAAMVRYRPEDYGYYPDNEAPAVSRNKPDATEIEDTQSIRTDPGSPAGNPIMAIDDGSLTPKEALRDRSFWLLSFAFAFRIMATSSVSLHLIPFLTDIGVSGQTASFMVSFLGIAGVVGRIGFGWLGDIFDKRYVLLGGLASLTIGMFILGASTTFWHAFLGLVFFSPAYGGLATMMFSIRGEYFGSRYFATIQGFMGSVIIIGPLFGPILAGWVFDTTGSYRIAFYSFAVMVLVAAALVWVARKPKKRVEAALRMRQQLGV